MKRIEYRSGLIFSAATIPGAILGDSSPTVTLNVYAHLMKSENQEAACRLEDTIFGSWGLSARV
jgi:hypothetical protein